MKIILRLATFLTFLLFLFVLRADNTFAATASVSPAYRDENLSSVTITFTGIAETELWLCLRNDGNCKTSETDKNYLLRMPVTSGTLTFDVCGAGNDLKLGGCNTDDWFNAGDYDVWLSPIVSSDSQGCPDGNVYCTTPDTVIEGGQTNFEVKYFYPDVGVSPIKPTSNDDLKLSLSGRRRGPEKRNDYDISLKDSGGTTTEPKFYNYEANPSFEVNFGKHSTGDYVIEVKETDGGMIYYKINVVIDNGGNASVEIIRDPENKDDDERTGTGDSTGSFGSGHNPCAFDGCQTALGFIPTTIAGFASTFLSIAIGLAGGIALILMVLGSVQILISSGNQQNLNAGRDRLVAAVAGLLFLIFSALILRFIGLNILGGIPGIG